MCESKQLEPMTIENREIFRLHAEFCKTVANEKRLMILTLLADGERNVGDLAKDIGVSVANVSQHLSVMRNRNIVRARKDGQTVYYSLAPPKLYDACLLIRSALTDVLESRGQLAKDNS